ncbi:MAG TPA: efflux RND transporter permease subunit, partial [Janthinobacterium sp.]|nr:efflux RND transporter permease subunit [Janthinobacterium sp.]
MWITKTSIQHPVFATMVMVALVVLGVFSYRGLGLERMPNVDIPGAWVEVQYPGASPEAVENDITRPMEEIINTVSGVKTIRSNSWEGRAGIGIEFELSVNIDRAMQDLRDKIGQVRPQFPKEAKDPLIARFEGENAQPIVQLTLTSDQRSLRELSTLTDQIIVKRIQGVAGVGQVRTNGTTSRQILISLKPADMTAQGIGVDEVVKAIQDTNQNLPAGSIIAGPREQLVRVEGKVKDAREFARIIVARRASGPVYLGQLADIVDGEKEETSISRINGQRAISLDVIKVQDANVVEVGKAILDIADQLGKTLPPDI